MSELCVLGGGFAGMWAALTAARESLLCDAGIKVTLVSRDPGITIRPRLYEPFTPEMRVDLRPVLAPLGIRLEVAEVTAVDAARRLVHLEGRGSERRTLPWEALVLALGSVQRPLPIPGATVGTFNIDTFEAAAQLAQHLGEVTARPTAGARTVVVIGAGFSGIEFATELRGHLRRLASPAIAQAARIVLLEQAPAAGPELGPGPRPVILEALAACEVELRLASRVAEIDAQGITLEDGERILADTVVITAGLVANPLSAQLPGVRDALGRLVVDENLALPEAPGIFVAGDLAHARTDETHVALMSCQHAVPMGKMAGHNAACHLIGTALRSYQQPGYVTCLDLGDAGAVLTSGWSREVVEQGPEVKALKRKINTRWISPPRGDREALMAAADLDAPWPPAD